MLAGKLQDRAAFRGLVGQGGHQGGAHGRRFRHARRRDPAIPVLVVSGYAAQLMSRLGVLDPPAVFISKPYDLEEIVDALKRLTERL